MLNGAMKDDNVNIAMWRVQLSMNNYYVWEIENLS